MNEIIARLTRLASIGVKKAQEENRKKGIPNVYVINGRIVYQLPDGTITEKDPFAKS